MLMLQSCQVELIEFLQLSLFRSRRDSVGGGGGSSIIFSVFSGTRPHSVNLQLRNHIFTPHRVIFMGRDTHFGLDTPEIRISC